MPHRMGPPIGLPPRRATRRTHIAPSRLAESASGAGAAEDSGNAGCAGSENAAGGADTAPGASAPGSENHAIAVESMMALGREDYMTALAMANPSAAAPSVVA